MDLFTTWIASGRQRNTRTIEIILNSCLSWSMNPVRSMVDKQDTFTSGSRLDLLGFWHACIGNEQRDLICYRGSHLIWRRSWTETWLWVWVRRTKFSRTKTFSMAFLRKHFRFDAENFWWPFLSHRPYSFSFCLSLLSEMWYNYNIGLWPFFTRKTFI